MRIDAVLLILMIVLSIVLAVGFLRLTREKPKLMSGLGSYRWDKYVHMFEPKRNYSIFEDPEKDELD
jgi:hypothetical protein